MASDVNMIILSGRLVADPELKFTSKGTAIASLRMASNRFYRDKDSPEGAFKETHLFITANTFGKTAERVAALKKKGDQVIVRGRLELNEWTGNDGKPRKDYRLFAEGIDFIGKKSADGAAQNESASSAAPVPIEAAEMEEIPF